MPTNQQEEYDKNKKTIENAIARVSGAVRVASIAVSASMTIKDEALDEVEALKKESNTQARNDAIKKISSDTKRVLGNMKGK